MEGDAGPVDAQGVPAQAVRVHRRTVVAGLGFLPLLKLLPPSMVRAAFAPRPTTFAFFDPHQAAVVEAATARLIPGPLDDPGEAGHPGAREAGVVYYVDLLLSAFDADPPRIYAGGPWSDRAGGPDNEMAAFVPLTSWQEEQWRARIADFQQEYREGIDDLDAAAGGDFAAASAEQQDQVLLDLGGIGFRRTLFEHAIEGTYAVPEYGGNHDLVGWTEIGFAGDVAPRGWTADEVSAAQPDPVDPDQVLAFPPDMATTGTEDPLGGHTLGGESEDGASRDDDTSGAAGEGAAGGASDDFFHAAEPGIAATILGRRPRAPRPRR